GVAALLRGGLRVAEVVANRVWPPPPGPCRACAARRRVEAQVTGGLAATVPLPPRPRASRTKGPRRAGRGASRPEAPWWLEVLAPAGRRLLVFGGKGGVGKTSCAATAALAIAASGRRTLLLSTDPAHSTADVLDVPLGDDEREVPG